MAGEDYIRAMRYEMLIRNVYNCPSGMRNGAHQCFMQNAISMEKGETHAKHLGSFEKQFDTVKRYLGKALLKLTKTSPYRKSADFFEPLHVELEHTWNTSQLMEIVDKALDKVNDIRN